MDDGSITVAQELRKAAQWPAVSSKTIDLRNIIGVNAEITSPTIGGAIDAALSLARLVDPVTRPTADGSCERCGAGPEALRDQYCAHCGRRVLRDAGDEATGDEATGDATEAVERIREARHALQDARYALYDEAMRERVWMGVTARLNDAETALFDIEEIARRESEEGDER